MTCEVEYRRVSAVRSPSFHAVAKAICHRGMTLPRADVPEEVGAAVLVRPLCGSAKEADLVGVTGKSGSAPLTTHSNDTATPSPVASRPWASRTGKLGDWRRRRRRRRHKREARRDTMHGRCRMHAAAARHAPTHSPETLSTHVPSSFFHSPSLPNSLPESLAQVS
jgi:hypothetical protein